MNNICSTEYHKSFLLMMNLDIFHLKLNCCIGFLLDRTALSAKNKWTDEDGKVYVFFTQDEAKEKLNIGTGKATKIFSELDEIGLIIRIRQGQGNPCKIYVMNFAKPLSQAQTSENQKSEKSKMEVLNSEKGNSRLTKSESLKQIKRKSRPPKNVEGVEKRICRLLITLSLQENAADTLKQI